MLYPIKFKSIYVDKIWGNDALKTIKRDIPSKSIGESLDLVFNGENISEVENGDLEGKSLKDLLDVYGFDFSGTNINPTRQFPITVKIITPMIDMSVTVHPDDSYAKRREADLGNSECYYVLDAKEEASIVLGADTRNKDDLFNLDENRRLADKLRVVPVKTGDFIEVPPGTIHAIGKGVILLSIEQNSDVVYRLYDYGRNRKSDNRQVKEIIDIRSKPEPINILEEENFKYTNKHYTIEKMRVYDSYRGRGNSKSLKILTCIDGEGRIKYLDQVYEIKKGDSYLIPSALKEFKIEGNLSLLRITIKKDRINQ